MQLENKVTVVTGGASGIGAAIAQRFAAEGAIVVVMDIHPNDPDGPNTRAGSNLDSLTVDVRDHEAVTTAMRQVHARYKSLDVLVNSAAIAHACPILEIEIDKWREIIDTNLTGVFSCAQAAGELMTARSHGRIINISSVNGQRAITGRGAYAAAKGGLGMLTKIMAAELGSLGVTVNAIAPGPVETPMVKKLHTQAMRDTWYGNLPIKRYADPEEVGAAAVYLASDEAAYVTGTTINVDGGFEATGMLMTN